MEKLVWCCELFFFFLHHSNLTELHVKSMEFNVLDSLNLKLVRPVSWNIDILQLMFFEIDFVVFIVFLCLSLIAPLPSPSCPAPAPSPCFVCVCVCVLF